MFIFLKSFNGILIVNIKKISKMEELNYYSGEDQELDLESESDLIQWEMDEYLHYRRSKIWYVVLFLSAFAISLLAYLATNQGLLAPLTVMSMALIIILYSLKKPQRHKYTLGDLGIQISGQTYNYSGFKNFSIITDHGAVALYLVTNQRFLPPLTLYLPADKGRLIIDRLSEYIAYNPLNLHLVDRLMAYFRF